MILINCCQDSQRNRYKDRQQNRCDCQKQCCRKLGNKRREHWFAGYITGSHVSVQKIFQPVEILDRKRGVESHLCLHLGDLVCIRKLTQHCRYRVTRDHIQDKKCPAGVCTAMKKIVINESLCRGCTKCARTCPVGAIEGTVKNPHHINQDKCIKCEACFASCPFRAIVLE